MTRIDQIPFICSILSRSILFLVDSRLCVPMLHLYINIFYVDFIPFNVSNTVMVLPPGNTNIALVFPIKMTNIAPVSSANMTNIALVFPIKMTNITPVSYANMTNITLVFAINMTKITLVFAVNMTNLALVQGWPTRGYTPGFLRLVKAGINYYFQNKFKQLSVLNFHVAIMTRNYQKVLNFAITSYL